MRKSRYLQKLLILAVLIFALWRIGLPRIKNDVQWAITHVELAREQIAHRKNPLTTNEAQTATSSSASSASATSSATPSEEIVRGQKLSNVYYYHFAGGIPAWEQQLWRRGIQTYNRLGIVSLRPGKGTQHDNTITLGQYRKAAPQPANGTVELGEGGPRIYQYSGRENYTVNRATAKLNVRYAKRLTDVVVLHEFGHALGLDHSTNPQSIMYPITQAKQQMTAADIAALKSIY